MMLTHKIKIVIQMFSSCYLMVLIACSDGEVKSEKKALTNDQVDSKSDIRFTFYKDLSKHKVEVSDEAKEAYTYTEDNNLYRVVVATFKNFDSAAQLIKKLANAEIVVSINTLTSSSGDDSYQIVAGPYKGKRAAHAAQNIIESLGNAGTYISLLK